MPLLKSKPTIEAGTIAKAQSQTPELTLAQTEQIENVKAAIKKAAKSETMTKADWADKDMRISRQGLFQACLQSVGLLQLNTGNTLEDYLKLVEQAAERGLEFVNRR